MDTAAPSGGNLRGCLMTPVVVVGAALLLVAFEYSMDMLIYPWAHALISHPTLTGGWYGQLRAANRNRTEVFGVYAEITHNPRKSYRYSDFDGQVHVCTPGGIQTAGRFRDATADWFLRDPPHSSSISTPSTGSPEPERPLSH
jgi:hypothetical protein